MTYAIQDIEGIGPAFAEKLAAANLAAKLEEVNHVKKLTRGLPGEMTVQGWIEQARTLEARVTH